MARGWGLEIELDERFEEALKVSWKVVRSSDPEEIYCVQEEIDPKRVDFNIEMVLDRSSSDAAAPLPAKDAMVKSVAMGHDLDATVQNMPAGRKFLIAVVGVLHGGKRCRSRWIRASTLHPDTRDSEAVSSVLQSRANCEKCPCDGYIPLARIHLNSSTAAARCRRCGCSHLSHVIIDVSAVLKAREEKLQKKLRREKLPKLPDEAMSWDDRECALYIWSDGEFHPRKTTGVYRSTPASASSMPGPGGSEGKRSKIGRVSIISPTMESRQKFHHTLWESFEAQRWNDKELVIVETYFENYSTFLEEKAKTDERLIYVKYKRTSGNDWSIGLKRNMATHLATGEYVANFDDDDLYGPTYLSTMVGYLNQKKAQAITLSSWFIVKEVTKTFAFCDAVVWGWNKGLSKEAKEVRSWAYGYGFSYVYRRQASLEFLYDDRDMGEDFNFVQDLLKKKGDRSVVLMHDDFGICLHVQHGGNTSDSFPIRDVALEEARDLDVASLNCMAETYLGGSTGHRRNQTVLVHTPYGDFQMGEVVGESVAKLLFQLEDTAHVAPGWLDRLKVYCIPPRGVANEDLRTSMAAAALGLMQPPSLLDKLAATAESPVSEQLRKSRVEQRQAIARLKTAMRSSDRIGLLTEELWLLPPGTAEDVEEELAYPDADGDIEWEDEGLINIQLTCQKSRLKHFLSDNPTVTVRLPVGSTVGLLRTHLTLSDDMFRKAPALPPDARILQEIPGKGNRVLSDADVLPEGGVTVSDFNGRKDFYVRLSKDQCYSVLQMLRAFWQKEENQRKLDGISRTAAARKTSPERQSTYRGLLADLLMKEAYPAIIRRYGLPQDGTGGHAILEAMAEVPSSLETLELQLQVEGLMRNVQSTLVLLPQVNGMREAYGLRPLAWNGRAFAEE